jgi:hypothetical protein
MTPPELKNSELEPVLQTSRIAFFDAYGRAVLDWLLGELQTLSTKKTLHAPAPIATQRAARFRKPHALSSDVSALTVVSN